MTTQFAHSHDEIRIAFTVQGIGPPLLLLHGFSFNRTLWAKYGWVDRLQQDFTVITMDLCGCGESDAPMDWHAYALTHHLADVHAALDACGVPQTRLWGRSFGGTIGLHLAARTARLTRAVIAGTYFGQIFTPAYVQENLAKTTAPLLRARWQGLEAWPAVNPAGIHCPLLLYTGTKDGNVVVQLEQQRAAIEAAGLRLHVFEGLNHLQLLSAPETIYPVVGPFLGR